MTVPARPTPAAMQLRSPVHRRAPWRPREHDLDTTVRLGGRRYRRRCGWRQFQRCGRAPQAVWGPPRHRRAQNAASCQPPRQARRIAAVPPRIEKPTADAVLAGHHDPRDPGCEASATISRFCSAVQRRRRSRRVITSMRRLPVFVRSVVGASSNSQRHLPSPCRPSSRTTGGPNFLAPRNVLP